MTYEDMADWLYYNLDPDDYTSFKAFYKGVAEEFGINDELARNIARPFWDEYMETEMRIEEEERRIEEEKMEREEEAEREREQKKEKPKEVKLTENQKKDIKNNDQNEDLTKREKTVETLEIANQEITVQQFYELNPNMLKPTARRELSTAVKRGELKRVRKGVYRRI